MHRLVASQQHGADSDVAAGGGFEQVVGNVCSVDVGQHQQIGLPGQAAVGHQRAACGGVERDIAMHLAVNFKPGR